MSCKSTQAKLSAYLDGEMSGGEMQAIRAHVHRCRDCQTELDGLKSVQMILRGLSPGPEPSASLPTAIHQSLVTTNRNILRLGLALMVPTVAIIVFSYSRPRPKPALDRDIVINRQLANDQVFDAGTDSTSGASLVHYTNYEGR